MSDLFRKGGKYWQVPALLAAFISLSFLSPKNPESVPTSETRSKSIPAITTPLLASAPVPAFSLADSSRLNVFYDNLNLQQLGLSIAAYHMAVTGFLNLVMLGQIPNPGLLSIIDFSQPSSQKRLFVIDMLNGKLLFNTLVAHGRNSGTLMANRFSNRNRSFMSSIGFYLTGNTFMGRHGYSLRLDGLEKGWNDNVHARAIIMHPAPYVSEAHVRQWGFLGRSEGCPALPANLSKPIIESIRGGSCIFIYGQDPAYLKDSKLTNPPSPVGSYA